MKQKQILHLKNITGQYSASENMFKATWNRLSSGLDKQSHIC